MAAAVSTAKAQHTHGMVPAMPPANLLTKVRATPRTALPTSRRVGGPARSSAVSEAAGPVAGQAMPTDRGMLLS